MTNLHDASVEAAAAAINNLDWTHAEFGEVPHERDIARAALAAADAVVTVDIVDAEARDVIWKALDYLSFFEDDADRIAAALRDAKLLRGGEGR